MYQISRNLFDISGIRSKLVYFNCFCIIGDRKIHFPIYPSPIYPSPTVHWSTYRQFPVQDGSTRCHQSQGSTVCRKSDDNIGGLSALQGHLTPRQLFKSWLLCQPHSDAVIIHQCIDKGNFWFDVLPAPCCKYYPNPYWFPHFTSFEQRLGANHGSWRGNGTQWTN